jgi:hypothetical protein
MKLRYILASLSLLVAGTLPAEASLILSDNFDGYADQAAFQAAWPAIGTVAPTSGQLSTAQSVSSPNSIRNAGTATTGQMRNRRSFGEVTAPSPTTTLVWSFDFYDSAPTVSPARNFSNLQDGTAPSATNQLVAMGLNNNQTLANSGGNYYMARILGYNVDGADVDTLPDPDPNGGPTESVAGSGAFFKLNDFGVGLRSAGWHNLKVHIGSDDGVATDYAFYVDGVLAELVSNVGTVPRQYDNIALGSGLSNASTEVFFDNMRLAIIPEPASLLLTGLLGLAIGCVRPRK